MLGKTWPDLEAFRRLAADYPLVPVLQRWDADLETPVSVFLKLSRGRPGYLLESVEGTGHPARYSFIGADPFHQVVSGEGDDPFAQVRAALADLRAPRLNRLEGLESLPGFTGGLVGYLGYDAVRALERLPDPPPEIRDLPIAWFMATRLLAVFDHLRHQVYLVSVRPRAAGETAERAYAEACRTLDEATGLLRQTVPPLPPPSPLPPAAGPAGLGRAVLESDFSRDRFLAAVARAKAYIAAGDVFQVVLSQRLRAPLQAHPFDLYRVLRRINPSPYLFYLDFGSLHVVGASPETLVRVEGDQVATRPIAGTRPRGRTPDEDETLEEDLRTDPKELAEHAMLLDLGRNDLGRVSRFGSVAVRNPMHVERYSHVMHLVSEVTGILAPGRDAVDAIAACFPAGTLTGAPKVRAMEIIDELEPVRRGPYGGAVGYFGFAGDMDACIAIRTAVVHDGMAEVQAGAGIVADSDPEREYEECRHKASALLGAVQVANQVASQADDQVANRGLSGERGETAVAAGDRQL